MSNDASGGDRIPAEVFKILKDDPVKVLHSICQQIWKPQHWPQDWKRSVFSPIPKRAMPKNVQTNVQTLNKPDSWPTKMSGVGNNRCTSYKQQILSKRICLPLR